MVSTLADMARAIGRNVRTGRVGRGWSLDEFAERSGVSRRMIVQIEHGQTNPSIGILLRLSDALGVGLPQLTAVVDSQVLQVVPAGRAPILWRGEHGGHAEMVAGTGPPDVFELWDWALQPGEVHGSEPHSAGTREQLLVIRGRLLLTVGDEQQLLEPGDAAAFPGDRWHRYQAPPDAAGPACFTLSVLQPDVGLPTPPTAAP